MNGTLPRSTITTARHRLAVRLAVTCGLLLVAPHPAAASFDWHLPPGFPTPKVSADNPPTAEKVTLGRFLFYDPRLSGNQTQSCASCHRQELAFTDGLDRAIGSTGEVHPRNSMSLANSAYGASQTWANPLLVELERQALVPIFGERPVELGLAGREDELLERLRDDARYRRLFAEAFPNDPEPISLVNLVRALTSFVRTILSGDAPYDRFIQLIDDNALSPAAQRGGRMFFSERFECFHCHGGFNLSVSVTFEGKPFDETSFQNNGLYNIDGKGAYPHDNQGLFEFTRVPEDMGSFKATTLRNIEITGPYMHDGSIATLDEVLDHYAAGGRTIHSGPNAGDGSKNPFKSNFVIGFTLSESERADLLAFLKGLTEPGLLTAPRFADPFVADTCGGDCNLDGRVGMTEMRQAVDVALGKGRLAGCVVADRDGDGNVTIEELTHAAGQQAGGCPAREEDVLLIGVTDPLAGEVALSGTLTPQVHLATAQCLGGSGDDCAGGSWVFSATKPALMGLTDRAGSRLVGLPDGAAVELEITTAIAPGASLQIGDVVLDSLGDRVTLGAAPNLYRDVEWRLLWPADQRLPRHVTLWFKLIADQAALRPSQPIAVVLLPSLPAAASGTNTNDEGR